MKNLIRKILKEGDFDWVEDVPEMGDYDFVDEHLSPITPYLYKNGYKISNRGMGMYSSNIDIEMPFLWDKEEEFRDKFLSLVRSFKSDYSENYRVRIDNRYDKNDYKRYDEGSFLHNYSKNVGTVILFINSRD